MPREFDDEDYSHSEHFARDFRAESACVESCVGSYVYSAFGAVVAPLDAFADVAYENRVAGSDFLPSEARWSRW